MNNLDSDLEEGEIIDDSPPSPEINKRKELPQRYIVKDSKTPIHKHKKGCKHAIRHHAKKISNMKKSPVKKKISPKIHHKPTCNYEKSRRNCDRHNNKSNTHTSSKNVFFPQNSLIAEMKNSLKFIPPLKNFNESRSQQISFLERNFKTPKKDFAVPELSNAKKSKNEINNFMEDTMSTNFEHLAEKPGADLDLNKSSDDGSSIELEVCDSTPPSPIIGLSNSPDDKSVTKLNSNNEENIFSNTKFKDEEIEDIEELRRIALATCANRKAPKELENIAQNIDHSCDGNDLSDINNDFNLPQVINNQTADNYEVVDMDLDDEMQDSLETVQISATNEILEPTENLYIIDTNPTTDFLQNEKNSFSEPQTIDDSDDEDFQANILRAELINSMYRKQVLEENAKWEKRNRLVNQKKFTVNYQKQNLQFSYKRLKSAKHFLRKRSINKLVNVNNNNSTNKTILPIQANKTAERLIITVNGESSDDSDEETKAASENPLDSISALISDCRQKSESTKEIEEVIPKAVACLSKAQQEEYNSLVKILAKKTKLSSQGTQSPKNGSIHSPLDNLKKLEKKLVELRNALQKKRESMAYLTEDVNSKKFHYMKSKLTVQYLKEQLVAAEKIRKTKLLEWSKSCDNLKLMKQCVSDLENKLDEMQNFCSKVGSSLEGTVL